MLVCVFVITKPVYSFYISNNFESYWISLKLLDGLNDKGFTNDVIFIIIIVEAGNTTAEMPLSCRNCVELIVKGVTGHVWSAVAVVFV